MVNKIGFEIFPSKKGWIKIVEAFVAVLLTAGVLLLVVGDGVPINLNKDSEIYDSQLIVLRDIQRDDELRQSVLNSSDGSVPSNIEERIIYLIPNYLECEAKICEIDALICNLGEVSEKSLYVQTVAITATLTDYNPKQLKLFCWRK